MKNKPIWRDIFLELTVRAFRKLNLDYGLWTLGQSSNHDLLSSIEKINNGGGIELVLEPDACSAITREFLNSTFTKGNKINNENRFYEINREVGCDGQSVDLFVNRYKIIRNNVYYSDCPTLIEAKRAHYYTPNLRTGKKGRLSYKYDEILMDIAKLENIKRVGQFQFTGYDNFNFRSLNIYVLFWGLSNDLSTVESEIYTRSYGIIELKNCHFKCFPITSAVGLEVNLKNDLEWCWICLYEINPNQGDKEKYNKIK